MISHLLSAKDLNRDDAEGRWKKGQLIGFEDLQILPARTYVARTIPQGLRCGLSLLDRCSKLRGHLVETLELRGKLRLTRLLQQAAKSPDAPCGFLHEVIALGEVAAKSETAVKGCGEILLLDAGKKPELGRRPCETRSCADAIPAIIEFPARISAEGMRVTGQCAACPALHLADGGLRIQTCESVGEHSDVIVD